MLILLSEKAWRCLFWCLTLKIWTHSVNHYSEMFCVWLIGISSIVLKTRLRVTKEGAFVVEKLDDLSDTHAVPACKVHWTVQGWTDKHRYHGVGTVHARVFRLPIFWIAVFWCWQCAMSRISILSDLSFGVTNCCLTFAAAIFIDLISIFLIGNTPHELMTVGISYTTARFWLTSCSCSEHFFLNIRNIFFRLVSFLNFPCAFFV